LTSCPIALSFSTKGFSLEDILRLSTGSGNRGMKRWRTKYVNRNCTRRRGRHALASCGLSNGCHSNKQFVFVARRGYGIKVGDCMSLPRFCRLSCSSLISALSDCLPDASIVLSS
jgi:RNase P protein component